MQLVEERPNVELRRDADGSPIVVLAFPYDPHVVALVRRIPGRRFDWDRREWCAPVDDWAGVHVADVLDRFPELTTSAEVDAWLRAVDRRWVGRVTTARHDGRGWFALHTRAGAVPEVLLDGAVEQENGTLLVPLVRSAAEAIEELRSARLDGAAAALPRGRARRDRPGPARAPRPPPRRRGRAAQARGAVGPRDRRRVRAAPGRRARRAPLPLDPWVVEPLDGFLARHGVAVAGSAADALDDLRVEAAEAAEAIRRSRATTGEPIPEVAERARRRAAARSSGPASRYALDVAPHVPRRRAGPRQDGRGARRARGRRRLPGGRRLPRVAEAQLGARDRSAGCRTATSSWSRARGAVARDRRHHDPQLRDRRRAPRAARAALRPRALVARRVALRKNPRAKRTQAVRRLAATLAARRAAPRADRHAGDQPRRRADQPAAGHRPPRGLRLRRALLAPVPGRR